MGLFVCFNGFHLLESLTVSVRIFYENNLKSFLILGLGKIYLLMKEYNLSLVSEVHVIHS